MCKALLSLKLLADAYNWQFLGRNLHFIFSVLPLQKTFPRHRAKERVLRKISSPGRVADMPSLLGEGECSAVMASESAIRYMKVPGDRGGHTGSLELTTRKAR